jgi:hydrogenase maturation protein HypF
MAALRYTVRGVVQGVGFRPFVYRLAHRYGLSGRVVNSDEGVLIDVCGPEGALDAFARALSDEAPPLARIDAVEREEGAEREDAFVIAPSERSGAAVTLICPDVATCADCLAEFENPSDRRYRYPFINCTNCGPRYSIIEETPYDRPATSMAVFTMCDACRSEYEDPMDRRFHAQPNACPDCGPRLELVRPWSGDGPAEVLTGRRYVPPPDGLAGLPPADAARELLKLGAIVGVKGLGGFHLAANAGDVETVRALREKKDRPAKPFALMCRTLDAVRAIAEVSPEEEALLSSPWAPIVLLRKRDDPAVDLPETIAPRNAYVGVMLPYTPVHRLLFDEDLETLIMTSANPSGEPIVADLDEARGRLRGVTRTFLDHNRGVVNRNDDSVAFIEAGRLMLARRSRGYAPYPIDVPWPTADVFAAGTELKATFTCLTGGRAYVSPHLGDLDNQATLELYRESVERFRRWFRVEPEVIAHDLHPDYLATRFAQDLAEAEGLPLVGVQHHHAHTGSVMAENGIDGRVLGLALDGTGYGTDGTIWGCEFLDAGLAEFERAGHLGALPLPGGDAAIRHPYRVALAHLAAAGVEDLAGTAAELFGTVPEGERDLVVQQTEKGVGAVVTSSAGRLFDAVSAIAGVCREISYEAQAAIELESLVACRAERTYPVVIREAEGLIVEPGPIVLAVLEDRLAGVDPREIAEVFHATVVDLCVRAATRIASERGLDAVALSGGVFQNRFLLRELIGALETVGLRPLVHRDVPTNDGGVSLGQAVVASEAARSGRPDQKG